MIGRKALVIIAAKMISAILGFIALFFISRYLGPGIYGTIAWTIALMASINSLADLGFSSAHIKRVSEGKDLGECVSTFATIRFVLTALMAIATIVGVLFYTIVMDMPLMDTSFDIIVIFLLYYVFYDIAGIAISTFDGRMESVLSQFSLIVDIGIRLPLVILVSINRMGAMELALAYLVGSLATLSLSMYFLLRKRIKFGRPVLFGSYMKFAVPVAMVIIIGALTANIDKVAIGFFLTKTQVGYYSAAQSILLIVASIGGAATAILFPAFSRLHVDRNIKEITRKTWQAERYLSVLCVPILLIFIVFPSESVNVMLGYRFQDSAIAIQILSFSTLIVLINQPYAIQLYSANHPRIIAWIEFGHLILLVILLLVMIPTSIMGIGLLDLSFEGAALANLISMIFAFVLARYYVEKLTGVCSNPRILFHLLAGILATAVLLIISNFFSMSHWFDLMMMGGIAYGIYLVVLWVMGELGKDDVKYLMEVMNLKKMKGYMIDEIKGDKEG